MTHFCSLWHHILEICSYFCLKLLVQQVKLLIHFKIIAKFHHLKRAFFKPPFPKKSSLSNYLHTRQCLLLPLKHLWQYRTVLFHHLFPYYSIPWRNKPYLVLFNILSPCLIMLRQYLLTESINKCTEFSESKAWELWRRVIRVKAVEVRKDHR